MRAGGTESQICTYFNFHGTIPGAFLTAQSSPLAQAHLQELIGQLHQGYDDPECPGTEGRTQVLMESREEEGERREKCGEMSVEAHRMMAYL